MDEQDAFLWAGVCRNVLCGIPVLDGPLLLGVGVRRCPRQHEGLGAPKASCTLTLIHPSAWKVNSGKSISRILHSPGPIGAVGRSLDVVEHRSQHYILGCWIDMRCAEFIAASSAPV